MMLIPDFQLEVVIMELQNLTPPQELETLSLELTSVFSLPAESPFKEAATWNV